MIPEAGEETLQAVLNGDAEAFRSILRSYGPRVERLVSAHVLPHEVPEVAQETFVRAYRSLRSYQGQGSFERWLATIALRCCSASMKKKTSAATCGKSSNRPCKVWNPAIACC